MHSMGYTVTTCLSTRQYCVEMAKHNKCFLPLGSHFIFKRLIFTLVKEALIEIGCVVTSLVVTRMHCGQTVHPRPIVTMEHY